MTRDEAKTIPVSHILEAVGASAHQSRELDAMYFTPFRKEKTASLHVDHRKNVWFDHGEGIGGDGIALVQRWLRHTREDASFLDALRWMGNMFAGNAFTPAQSVQPPFKKSEPAYKVLKVQELENIALVRYLEGRGFPLTIARQHLKQLYVLNKKLNKRFAAIGFKNEEGGWELRTPFLKSSIAPKGLKLVRGTVAKPKVIHLFEGWPDFLSAMVIRNGRAMEEDVIVLNSLSFTGSAFALMKGYGYETLYSWTHNDEAGRKALALIDAFTKTEPGLTHRSMNHAYASVKDLNDHLKQRLGL